MARSDVHFRPQAFDKIEHLATLGTSVLMESIGNAAELPRHRNHRCQLASLDELHVSIRQHHPSGSKSYMAIPDRLVHQNVGTIGKRHSRSNVGFLAGEVAVLLTERRG